MKTIPVQEAVGMIPNGATLMIGGFMACGTPEPLVDELVRQRKRELETAPGVTVEQVRASTEADLSVPAKVPQMAI